MLPIDFVTSLTNLYRCCKFLGELYSVEYNWAPFSRSFYAFSWPVRCL